MKSYYRIQFFSEQNLGQLAEKPDPTIWFNISPGDNQLL